MIIPTKRNNFFYKQKSKRFVPQSICFAAHLFQAFAPKFFEGQLLILARSYIQTYKRMAEANASAMNSQTHIFPFHAKTMKNMPFRHT